MFQCSFFCHCYLTPFWIILLSGPPSISCPIPLYFCHIFICFGHSQTVSLRILHIMLSDSSWQVIWLQTALTNSNTTPAAALRMHKQTSRCHIFWSCYGSAKGIGWNVTQHWYYYSTTLPVFLCKTGTQFALEGALIAALLLWLCLCCVNLKEHRPIYKATTLFHSCLNTHTHTQRKC